MAGFRAAKASKDAQKLESGHALRIRGSKWAETCDNSLNNDLGDSTTPFFLRTATRESGGRTVSVVMEAQAGDTVTRLLDAIE